MVLHDHAVNVARRLSSRNEPDLLQESYYDDNDAQTYSKEYCNQIAAKISNASAIPVECHEHSGGNVTLTRKDSQHDHAVAFEGLSAGDAAAAMAARNCGRLSHSQIQRRMTNSGNRYKSNW